MITHPINFAAYRADDITPADTLATATGKACSKSLIASFAENPARWKASPKREATAAMRAGSLLDCLLTTPELVEDSYIVSPYAEFRTNESKQWRDCQIATVITQSDMDQAEAQAAAIYAKPEAAALMRDAKMQVGFRHKTPYVFDSKGLIDIVPQAADTLVDLKTCQPGALESHRAMQRHMYDWGYHIQAGAYMDGYNIASGEDRHRFKFIFVSSKPPYTVAVIELPLASITYGAKLYANGMGKLAECLASNTWPGPWDGLVELDIPSYGYEEGDQ
jgi:PDDEXK-like domain of unknown function (DUF3799)